MFCFFNNVLIVPGYLSGNENSEKEYKVTRSDVWDGSVSIHEFKTQSDVNT